MKYNFEYQNAYFARNIIKDALKNQTAETNERMGTVVKALKDYAQKNKSKKAFFNAMEQIWFDAYDCKSEEELDAVIFNAIYRFFK